ncbi:MAG: hypothetical protein ACOZBW_05055 [Thermodesulfobacteriota bacterium]
MGQAPHKTPSRGKRFAHDSSHKILFFKGGPVFHARAAAARPVPQKRFRLNTLQRFNTKRKNPQSIFCRYSAPPADLIGPYISRTGHGADADTDTGFDPDGKSAPASFLTLLSLRNVKNTDKHQ